MALTNPDKVKVLLLAGGLGTRLRPLTDHTAKCLVPIAGRPLLDYWVDRFAEAGIREVLINNHHLPEQVRTYIEGVNGSGRICMHEAYEPVLLGSAGTVHANRDFVKEGDTALIVYADNLSRVDLRALLNFHQAHGDPATMMLFRVAHPERCGIAHMDDAGRITRFVEKPKQYMGNLANAGLYALTAAAYHEIADMNRFDIGFDVLPAFVGRMRGWIFEGYHVDVGTPEALAKANAEAPGVFGAAGSEARGA
jgi:mannose-1-phosphate guanylyltransferase